MPPTPIPARRNFSLGGFWLAPPSTCRGTIETAEVARAVVLKKALRVCSMIWPGLDCVRVIQSKFISLASARVSLEDAISKP